MWVFLSLLGVVYPPGMTVVSRKVLGTPAHKYNEGSMITGVESVSKSQRYFWAKPQNCVAASHRKNLRRRITHRGNFRCNLTADNLLCDVVFAIRRRNAVLWPRPL